ncbi:MAG: U32 family peptidase [Clostridiales Family XIII bacterium]|jgi:putative protease|nr:U32 family peptidase [Clostridiales Family XIII bacterium]
MVFPELLAPAGDIEKLRVCLRYGADAVYFGGMAGSLRTGADNFSVEDIYEGVSLCHAHSKKAYLALNIVAHDEDFADLGALLDETRDAGIDAYIVSDPGVFELVLKRASGARQPQIHISTQANVTNALAARFWHNLGAKRIILARELSLDEIRAIRSEIPAELELEAFVHGAMCISYSGRCLLSNVMTGRDANRGNCAHPCRYSYALEEEKRPGEYLPVREDVRGTYILNSKDLCMVGRLADMARAGITSFKIEGRVKSPFYVATVTRVYREAIDALTASDGATPPAAAARGWMEELAKASHRGYTAGFYDGKPDADAGNYETSGYVRNYTFIGIVREVDGRTGSGLIEQRNKFSVGDILEIFGPAPGFTEFTVSSITDENGASRDSAPHPKELVRVPLPRGSAAGDMLRRRESANVIG